MTRRSPPFVGPAAPSDLVAVAIGCRQVILAWTEDEAGGLGFHIERAVCNSPCGEFVEIGVVGPQVTAFSDGDIRPCTTYSYRVHAWNASGHSSASNVVEVTTPPAGPGPPVD